MSTMKKNLKKKWAWIECIMGLTCFFHRWMNWDENTVYRSIPRFGACRYNPVSKHRWYLYGGWVHVDTSSWRERSRLNSPIRNYPLCQCRSIPSKQSYESHPHESSRLKIEDGFTLQNSPPVLCEGWKVMAIHRLHWFREEEKHYLRIEGKH